MPNQLKKPTRGTQRKRPNKHLKNCWKKRYLGQLLIFYWPIINVFLNYKTWFYYYFICQVLLDFLGEEFLTLEEMKEKNIAVKCCFSLKIKCSFFLFPWLFLRNYSLLDVNSRSDSSIISCFHRGFHPMLPGSRPWKWSLMTPDTGTESSFNSTQTFFFREFTSKKI